MNPREISISITDDCNAKCIMCNIWAKKEKREFDNNLLSQLPAGLRNITITGGEPFLRRDIVAAVEKIKNTCRRARVVITTNGILTELIAKDVKEILKIEPQIAIRVSLDGIGEAHDRIRGYPQASDQAMRTIRLLKGLGVKDLGIHITLINANIGQLGNIYNLASREKIKFNCQIAHSSDFYFNKINEEIADKDLLRIYLNQIISSELKTFNPYKLFKTYYYKGMWGYVNHFLRKNSCQGGNLFCYIDAQGDIYPCIMLKEKMGSLKENSFSRVWMSRRAEIAREKVARCDRNCWLICTIAPEIKNRPLKAGLWVLQNKAKAHLGCKDYLQEYS